MTDPTPTTYAVGDTYQAPRDSKADGGTVVDVFTYEGPGRPAAALVVVERMALRIDRSDGPGRAVYDVPRYTVAAIDPEAFRATFGDFPHAAAVADGKTAKAAKAAAVRNLDKRCRELDYLPDAKAFARTIGKTAEGLAPLVERPQVGDQVAAYVLTRWRVGVVTQVGRARAGELGTVEVLCYVDTTANHVQGPKRVDELRAPRRQAQSRPIPDAATRGLALVERNLNNLLNGRPLE